MSLSIDYKFPLQAEYEKKRDFIVQKYMDQEFIYLLQENIREAYGFTKYFKLGDIFTLYLLNCCKVGLISTCKSLNRNEVLDFLETLTDYEQYDDFMFFVCNEIPRKYGLYTRKRRIRTLINAYKRYCSSKNKKLSNKSLFVY